MSVSDEPGNGEGVSLTACVALKVSIGSDRSWHLEVPIKSTHVGPTEDDNPKHRDKPWRWTSRRWLRKNRALF